MAEQKTNVMRVLEQKKIPYTAHAYPHGDEAVDGVTVAKLTGLDPAQVFKTLVTRGASKKNYVFVIPVAEELDLKKAGEEIFAGQPAMQADYNRQIEEQGFEAPVQMDQEQTLKKVAKHKLKTDTGIELTIPTDYFDNTQYLEFNNWGTNPVLSTDWYTKPVTEKVYK